MQAMHPMISTCQDQRNRAHDERIACVERAATPAPIMVSRKTQHTIHRERGFTLVELMIVVAVAGILSSVAYPSFMGQLQKIRRSDALVSMLQIQAAQERWRANNVEYGTLVEIGAAATSAVGHYTLSVAAPSATGYEVLATAQGAQAHDDLCRNLRIRVDGGNVVQTSGPDAATANAASANRQCWSA